MIVLINDGSGGVAPTNAVVGRCPNVVGCHIRQVFITREDLESPETLKRELRQSIAPRAKDETMVTITIGDLVKLLED